MPKETVAVACRLPNGIIIRHPQHKNATAKLNGISSSQVIGATFGITDVDAELWVSWKAIFSKSPLMQSHAVFEVRNEAEASAKAKELRNEFTGFEQVQQSAMGVSKVVS